MLFRSRYADLLPDGPARDRAAATARSVAKLPGPLSLDGLGTIIGPDVEFVDHGPVGLPPSRGREAYLDSVRSFLELVDDTSNRVEDVLGLHPDAFLLRITNFGTERASGGAFERPVLLLSVFDADGLATHWEFFDPDRDVDALARFDEVTGEPPPARFGTAPSPGAERRIRRVRANAATANAGRMDVAIAALDADAIAALYAPDAAGMEHHTGAARVDRRGSIFSYRSLLSAQNPTLRHEPLAILGDALALCRVSTSASGYATGEFDVGDRKSVV